MSFIALIFYPAINCLWSEGEAHDMQKILWPQIKNLFPHVLIHGHV